MSANVYRITIDRNVEVNEVEQTLHLAILAVEGLFGEAEVRMDMAYYVDRPRGVLVIDGSNSVGRAVIRVFVSLLLHEIGRDGFTVRQVPQIQTSPVEETA